ncbi:MAG: hypothetical protein QXD19_03870 [Candidatus Bathyarchaeia archaeon]
MSYEVTPQEREHYKKLMEIRKLLLSGPKTWNELIANLKMSKPTLSKCLIELQKRGEVQKIGILEGDTSKVVYKLTDDPTIKKVYEMFEEGDFFFPVRVKKNLDIEQMMITWFYHDIRLFLHFARKLMKAKNNAKKEEVEYYIRQWISFAMDKVSENMKDSLQWIAKEGEKSWEETFCKYETEPEPLIKALWKYAEVLKKAREEREKQEEQLIKEGKVKVISGTKEEN